MPLSGHAIARLLCAHARRIGIDGVSGHTPRRSVARLMHEVGWTNTEIQEAGRWNSVEVMRGDVGIAPARRSAGDLLSGPGAQDCPAGTPNGIIARECRPRENPAGAEMLDRRGGTDPRRRRLPKGDPPMAKNRGAEAMAAEMMQGPIPDELRAAAKRMGVAPDVTLGEFLDVMRVYTHRADPEAIRAYLAHFAGWEIALEDEEDVPGIDEEGEEGEEEDVAGTIGQGARIGTVRVARKKTPVYAHMGYTDMFDRTDPALEKLFTRAAKARKVAIVLQVMPRFFIDADASGKMHKVLFQGGWHFAGDMWAPFLLTQAGPDDIPAQRNVLKPGAPSGGLLRERGQDPDLLNAAHDLHASFVNRMAPDEREKLRDLGRTRIATGPTGWSFFGSDAAHAAHDELMSSLAVPHAGPRTEQDADDIDDLLEDAPEGIARVVNQVIRDPDKAEAFLEHLAELTNGFEGLDDAMCEDLTPEELSTLINCASAAVSAFELTYWLQEGMGWEFSAVNFETEGEEEILIDHGEYIAHLELEGRDEPVPVMFHGGKIDPTDAAGDFAFLTTRAAAQARTDGGPVIVMPAVINIRAAPGEKSFVDGGGMERIVIMAGYAFDGQEWFPVSFGERGSDPFLNRLGKDLLPVSEAGYTGSLSLPLDEEGARVEKPPLTLVYMLQETLDRHHDLGPDVSRPRDFNPMTDYKLQPWDDDWLFFLDLGQEATFERLRVGSKMH